MTRNEFIQRYVIATATQRYPLDQINQAVTMANEVEKVAPFDVPKPDEDVIVKEDLGVFYMPDGELVSIQEEAIRNALDKSHGNRHEAARILGISERTLYRKIKEYNI